jgi:hypothetical protein
MDDDAFLASARATYVDVSARTLRWMLARPRRHGAFVDTKVNPITLRDYGPQDGWRGPDVTFGWIQGRALEAIATHAAYFAAEDPALSADLDTAGRALYGALGRLFDAHGHGYFAYDRDLRPTRSCSRASSPPRGATRRRRRIAMRGTCCVSSPPSRPAASCRTNVSRSTLRPGPACVTSMAHG